MSQRGGVGQPPPPISVVSLLSPAGDGTPAAASSSSSSGIGGDGGPPDAMSHYHTSPLAAAGPRNWRPISPLASAGRPYKPPSPPDAALRVSPSATALVNPLESSLGHSRYPSRHPALFIIILSLSIFSFLGEFFSRWPFVAGLRKLAELEWVCECVRFI